MLYLLDKDVRTVKWNGIPLHEASSAIVKEELNSDFTLSVRYPITDSGVYQLIREDMLIKAPSPVLGPQLFRIKKPVENDDSLDITAYHITDDIMQRSIEPVSVVGQGCAMALSQMVQNAKTDLGTFSFTSDIMDSRTFNTTETETLYSVLMDGKHSIVGTWEGELVRDNFAMSIKRSRGADRGVVITTHKNLKSYQRTKNSQSVVTRIHAKSTFKAEGAEEETTITVTVDSPLIGNYPYINEKDYENNNAKTVDELRKWAEAKFKNEGIDKISDAIEIEAYELDGQVIHLGDTVNIKSKKHSVDIYKKAIAYEYNALTEEYISITFDDKPGVGGSGVSSGLSNAADVILSANRNTQEIAIERAVRNANQAFDAEFEKRAEEINDGIKQSKAEAERYADAIKQEIDTEIAQVEQSMQSQAQEHDRQVADILSKTQSVESLANQAKSDAASAIARANQVKAEAIADARAQVATVSQALNTAKTELQSAIASADQKARDIQASATVLRNDLNLQASKILEQARAQTALTSRVTSVETLADGTRSTVAELSKTVSKATGDITNVTNRTKTVEDTLSQTRTQYEALTQTVNAQTGQIDGINRKTADLQSGIDGVTERFENLRVGSRNYLRNASFISNSQYWYRNQDQNLTYNLNHSLTNKGKPGLHMYSSSDNAVVGRWKGIEQRFKIQQPANTDYVLSLDLAKDGVSTDANIGLHFIKNGEIKQQAWFNVRKSEIQASYKRYVFKATSTYDVDEINVMVYVGHDMIANLYVTDIQLEVGNVASDFQLSDEDLRSDFATYVRTATENSAELARRIETADGKAVDAKSYAQQTAEGFKSRIESLETYKNEEGARASQYLTASREETARQLTAERTAIATNYLAKSVYEEDIRGTTLKLNEIKSTADTAKQNLATYQNTVDRKLEELTSSTQTLDGKINTASAKVDTVAGQIRTEISEVEGKIPTEVGGRNYFRGYRSNEEIELPVYANVASFIQIYNRLTYPLPEAAGKTFTISFEAISPNGDTILHVYNANLAPQYFYFNRATVGTATNAWKKFKVTVKPITNTTYTLSTNSNRLELYAPSKTGVKVRNIKVELGAVATDWSPAPEDFANELSSVKTTITQTASGVEQLSTSLTTTDSKVTAAEAKIRQLISDVSSKVSQTDYNTLTGRVDSAETAITQNATEISKRLTSTQVESAITGKGYQTKAQVDNNITGRGYITNRELQPYALSTTVQNLVHETATSFSRTISETKSMIPTEAGGRNYILGSRTVWIGTNNLQTCPISTEQLKDGSREFIRIRRSNPSLNPSLISLYTEIRGFSSEMPTSGKGKISFKARASAPVNMNVIGILISSTSTNLPWNKSQISIGTEWKTYSFDFEFVKGMTVLRANPLQILPPVPNLAEFYLDLCEWQLEAGSMTSSWSPAPEDLATVTALHSVRDTVDSHTRTIGAVGTAGSILDNVSKVTQTAAGLVQEVSGTNGLKTQVSQLAGSYAIQNLTSSGTVLNQLNLNKDGSVKIDGKLVQITGTTYIQDGVIASAKIAGLDAGKITTGTLNAARIKANSIDGSKIVFDQAFLNKMTANEAYLQQLFAKDAFLTAVQAVSISASQITGGLMRATNGAMEVNLNAGQILYYTDQAALKRVLSGYPTQFVKFATGTVTGKGNAGVTVIGSNRWNSESSNDGGFVGIRAWNGSNIDQIDVVGDTVRLASSAFESADGWTFNTLPGKLVIDTYNNNDRPSSKLHIGDINIYRTDSVFVSLKDVLQQFNHNFKHLVNITGRGDVILTWDTIK